VDERSAFWRSYFEKSCCCLWLKNEDSPNLIFASSIHPRAWGALRLPLPWLSSLITTLRRDHKDDSRMYERPRSMSPRLRTLLPPGLAIKSHTSFNILSISQRWKIQSRDMVHVPPSLFFQLVSAFMQCFMNKGDLNPCCKHHLLQSRCLQRLCCNDHILCCGYSRYYTRQSCFGIVTIGKIGLSTI
jgi:hypothetical protein